jgi:hypothetical protein
MTLRLGEVIRSVQELRPEICGVILRSRELGCGRPKIRCCESSPCLAEGRVRAGERRVGATEPYSHGVKFSTKPLHQRSLVWVGRPCPAVLCHESAGENDSDDDPVPQTAPS